jgi:alkanesulfonate monooxygenase SsuD/methylene tetrahydromethanopterin reductase-like flavin-dependent oxidoreductase (luciferase family)
MITLIPWNSRATVARRQHRLNVGIYFDLRNPPERAVDPSRLYGFTLEVCEEADSLGCHSIWLSEHHLFDDGYLPQPLTFGAAVAARTRHVRVGTAIVVAPLHHVVELAEQAAVVDIVSAGRLELGLGAGYRVPEFELFGADLGSRYSTTDECARSLRRLWDVVTPRPVQHPVPIWMGYQGPKGARRAGLLGEALLTANSSSWPPYRDALVEAGHDPAAARMAGGINGWVTEDPDGDWPLVTSHVAAQFDSYRRHMVEGTGRPVPRPVDPEQLRARAEPRGPLDSIVYGTPDEVAAAVVAATSGAPVETVFLWASIAGMPDEVVVRGVRIICTELAPLLSDYDPMRGRS